MTPRRSGVLIGCYRVHTFHILHYVYDLAPDSARHYDIPQHRRNAQPREVKLKIEENWGDGENRSEGGMKEEKTRR